MPGGYRGSACIRWMSWSGRRLEAGYGHRSRTGAREGRQSSARGGRPRDAVECASARLPDHGAGFAGIFTEPRPSLGCPSLSKSEGLRSAPTRTPGAAEARAERKEGTGRPKARGSKGRAFPPHARRPKDVGGRLRVAERTSRTERISGASAGLLTAELPTRAIQAHGLRMLGPQSPKARVVGTDSGGVFDETRSLLRAAFVVVRRPQRIFESCGWAEAVTARQAGPCCVQAPVSDVLRSSTSMS